MTRPRLALAILAFGATVVVGAQNTVTFILVSGDRVSGAIASSSEASPAMPRGELNLEREGGEELNFGMEQVAVIDFAGGTPSQAELSALPGDENDQMVMFRDGSFWHGRFEDLRPRELRWRMAGRQEVASVDRISRIYLNTGRAKAIFGPVSGAAPTPGAGAARGWQGMQAGPITVPGTQAWTDSYLNVRRGDRLQFTVTGQIRVNAQQASTPAGLPGARPRGLPVADQPLGALIARIGNGRAFAIGANNVTLTMTSDGRLWLGINDTSVADNAGEFIVNVSRSRVP